MTEELQAKFSPQQSFYGKAHVVTEGNRITLVSYKTVVAELNVKPDDVDVTIYKVYDDNDRCISMSATTLVHIKEFLMQNGLVAKTKSQILKDYNVKEVYQ